MSERVGRVLAFVPTRKAAVALVIVALCVFWFQALGWPMAKGRDTWDYLAYYLQLFDSKPPLSQVQLFRAPLTPVVLGLPLALGESDLGATYGARIDELERRLGRLEQGPAARVRRLAGTLRS